MNPVNNEIKVLMKQDDSNNDNKGATFNTVKDVISEARKVIRNDPMNSKRKYSFWPYLEKEVGENVFDNVKILIDQVLSKIPQNSKDKNKNIYLIKKYFTSWKNFVRLKNEKKRNETEILLQKEKMEKFLKKIKKKQQQNNKQNKLENLTINKNLKKMSTLGVDQNQIKNDNNAESAKKSIYVTQEYENVYKHRFQAQQNIINIQKYKLQQQNKLIEEFKLGTITKDLEKSLEYSKIEIREIFKKSSAKVKCKVSPLVENVSPTKSLNFELKTEKAPKIVQEMEKRAQERALKRRIILERKRLIDEEKKRTAALILEHKRMQDEEEKKRNLEAMKEKRRKEMLLQKVRRINKERYLNNLEKAVYLNEKHLKMFGVRCFINLIKIKRRNNEKSVEFYKHFVKREYFNMWLIHWHEIEAKTNEKADVYYRYKILSKCISLMKMAILRKKQSMQVAFDLYQLRLEIKTFSHWHRYVCKQYMIEHKNAGKAIKHYSSRILWQYFYQWRKLPAVLQIEKAKEEKLKKWREKVWDIIPDYKPEVK